MTAGSVGYRPDGCIHTVTTQNGATVLAVLTGDIEPATDRRSAPPSQIFTLSELPWLEVRPGVRQKRIWEDKATERRALLARFEPGATLPPHRHVGRQVDSWPSLTPPVPKTKLPAPVRPLPACWEAPACSALGASTRTLQA